MKLWTIQLSQWRLAKERDIPLVNTTVKSGLQFLAPRWDMVLGHKDGSVSDEVYTEQYLEMMANNIVRYPEKWEALLEMEELAIACYCRAGAFCHRRLLVGILEKMCEDRGVPFTHMGELVRSIKS